MRTNPTRRPSPKPQGTRTADGGRSADNSKGDSANRSDSAGYAEDQTEKEVMGRGEPRPTQRSKVVPRK